MGSLQQSESTDVSENASIDVGRSEQQRIVLWAAAVLFFYVLGQSAYAPVSPFIWTQTEMGDGDDARGASLHGWGTAANALAQFLTVSLLGVLSDRFGRRPLMMLSCLGQIVDFLAAALAVRDSPLWLGSRAGEILFAARCFAGLCGHMNIISRASMGDISTAETSARNFTLVFGTIGVAGIIGVPVGSVLGSVFGLHVPMFVAAAGNILGLLIVIFLLPEPLGPENRKRVNWCSVNPLGAIAFMRSSRFLLIYAPTSSLVAFGFHLFVTFLVPYSEVSFGVEPVVSQNLLLAFGISHVFGCACVLQPMVRRKGEVWVWNVGYAALCACFVLLALIHYTGVFALMYVATVACGIGYISVPTRFAVASRCVGPDQQGLFQAGDGTLDLIGKVLSTGLTALAFEPLHAAGQLNAIWWVALGAQVPAAAATILCVRRCLPSSFRESRRDKEHVGQNVERSRMGVSKWWRTPRRTSPEKEGAHDNNGSGHIEAL